MLALLRTRRWLSFTVTAVFAIIAFGLLSDWQWGRAHEEDSKTSAARAGAGSTPVALTSVVAPGEALPPEQEWRAVTAAGVMDCSRGYLMRNRPMEGSNGFWAVCPMRLDDGSWVWVNRGWLRAGGPASMTVEMPAAPSGEVRVDGRLRSSQSGPATLPADLPQGQATQLDTDVLAAASGLPGPVYDPYVEVTGVSPADSASLKPLPLPGSDSAQNYSYAGQWALFAAVTIGGWWYFLRREARDVAAEAVIARQ